MLDTVMDTKTISAARAMADLIRRSLESEDIERVLRDARLTALAANGYVDLLSDFWSEMTDTQQLRIREFMRQHRRPTLDDVDE